MIDQHPASMPRQPLWLYPIDRMNPGDATFVTDAGGLADAAERAVRCRRQIVTDRGLPDRYSSVRQFVLGIAGLIVRRVA